MSLLLLSDCPPVTYLGRDGIAVLRDFNYSWSVLATSHFQHYPTPGLYTLLALESIKDLSFISNLQGAALTERSGIPPANMQSRRDDHDKSSAPVVLDSSRTPVQRLHLDPIEPIEYAVGGDPREGPLPPPSALMAAQAMWSPTSNFQLPPRKCSRTLFRASSSAHDSMPSTTRASGIQVPPSPPAPLTSVQVKSWPSIPLKPTRLRKSGRSGPLFNPPPLSLSSLHRLSLSFLQGPF
jgi:hypothetical protein